MTPRPALRISRLAPSAWRLPIRWKLTVWSASMMLLLFAAYNTAQYVYIERWIAEQAESAVRRNMHTALNYLLEREAGMRESDAEQMRIFLGQMNSAGQMIRVADERGARIVSVSNGVPEAWADAAAPASMSEPIQVRHEGHDLIAMRSPITIFEFRGTLEILRSMDEFELLSAAYSRVMIAFGAGAVVLFGLGGSFLAGRLLGPLQSLAGTIRSIRRNGLQERAPVSRSGDEIVELIKLFNDMMDDVQRSFAQQRQFVEDASHELRTPIAIVQGHLRMLQRWGKRDPAVLEESLQAAAEELARLGGLAEELLALSRAEREEAERETVRAAPVGTIAKRTAAKASLVYPAFRIEAALDGWDTAAVDLAPDHLEQAMLIVLDNAVKYSGTSRVVTVKGYIEGNEARLEIADFGIGIPERELPHVTDRLYRVDKARGPGGHGLGLAIAKRLVSRYGGGIAIRSKVGEGTTVTLAFPLSGAAGAAAERRRSGEGERRE